MPFGAQSHEGFLVSAVSGSRWRLVGVVVSGLALAGVAAWVVSTPPADELRPGCYAEDDLGSHVVAVEAAAPRDLMARCAELWRRGEVQPNERTAPPLVACSREAGPVAVFPGEPGICAILGLRDVQVP